MNIEAYPLSWPMGRPRTRTPQPHAHFDKRRTVAQATQKIVHELELLGARNIIVSTNVPLRLDGLPRSNYGRLHDEGAAVYFTIRTKNARGIDVAGIPTCLGCDRWNKVEHNLWAIALWIESERQQLRNGVGTIEQAFAGFRALPMDTGGVSCWELLGVKPGATADDINAAWRERAKAAHPDTGGSHESMTNLNTARDQALSMVQP